ncbi:MAG: FAD-binding protein [Steroidobacteraceae bacterium]
MHRRNVLRGLAALPLLAAPAPSLLAASRFTRATLRRVRPADPAWPTAAQWQQLNGAVGGNLIRVQPLFGACEAGPAGAACQEVLANLRNPFYLGDQPAGTEVSGWLDAWTPAPSAYAVKAGNTAEVVAAVNFARTHDLRLVVKGAGHSYQGTSSAADSLLVWTRAMNEVMLHDAFVPRGCQGRSPPVAAVSAGAGAMWIDLYDAVTSTAGRYVQGGGCTTVGVAGLVQSGGFGSFSKGFGTAASGLLEAEVVTADGQVRIANACSNPELFWALKGGGGGSFGVITRLTLRTHALPEFFGAAWGTIRAQSDAAFRNLLTRFVRFYAEQLFNPHWGEQVAIGTDNTLALRMACQGLGQREIAALWQPFFAWVAAAPQDFTVKEPLRTAAIGARHWWEIEGTHRMIRDPRAGAAAHHGYWDGDQGQVGAFLHAYDSVWLPASLLQEHPQRLVNALFAASRHKEVGLHFNKGLAGAPDAAIAAALDTATNPGVIGAFALAIIADGEGPAYPSMARPAIDLQAAHADARAIAAASAEMRAVAPGAGSYVAESNFFNAGWQDAFWGSHYPRLRAVKAQYDPDGLFFVHHGVGSEQWSADGFTRLA